MQVQGSVLERESFQVVYEEVVVMASSGLLIIEVGVMPDLVEAA